MFFGVCVCACADTKLQEAITVALNVTKEHTRLQRNWQDEWNCYTHTQIYILVIESRLQRPFKNFRIYAYIYLRFLALFLSRVSFLSVKHIHTHPYSCCVCAHVR